MMSPNRKMLMFVVIAGVILLVMVMTGIMKMRPRVSTAPVMQTVMVKEALMIKKENLLDLTGSVEAGETAVVSAKTAGRVEEISVDNGDAVASGQCVVRLDDTDYINQLAASQALLDKARVNLASMQSNYERGKTLFEAGAISQKDYDDLVNGLKAAQADVAAAKASVASSSEALSNTAISSPITGVAANRSIHLGQILAAGTPVLLVQDLTSVNIIVKVQQKDLSLVKTGMGAAVKVDTFPEHLFVGQVGAINPVAESGVRAFACKVLVPNPDSLLKPGMFARVSLKIGDDQQVLAVPLDALNSRQGIYYVFLPSGDKAQQQRVEIGAIIGNMVEIKSGLNPGQKIIASNVSKLKDQDLIRISSGQEE